MTQFRDAYGFHTLNVRRVHGPGGVGPCVDIGDAVTVTAADARQLADAVRRAAGPDKDAEERVWLGWLAAAVCSFAALEYAMPTKLSNVLRRHLRIHPQRPGHRLFGMALVGLLAWFGAHVLDEHHHG